MSHPQYGNGAPRVLNGVWFIRYDGEVRWRKITLNLSTDEAVSNYKWAKSIVEYYGPISIVYFEILSPDSVDLEEDYLPIEIKQEFIDNVIFRLKQVELTLDKRLAVNDEFWMTTKQRIEELENEVPRLKKILTDLAGKEMIDNGR